MSEPSKACHLCGKIDAEPKCPDCGAHLIYGYGFAGGGLGPYKMCGSCDYFEKEQDRDDTTTTEN
jgi:RNA polymerase subunit RPABC4/transcription elongation factor Spt4